MSGGVSDEPRISHIGLVARSPEGHAAKGMQIKGNEDLWVEIQANTFRNWVNEHLKTIGLSVRDLSTDFCDGTRLVALVEVLQKKPLKKIVRPSNQHQYLENVTTALNAISADGVRLVNIGNVDIVNGNLKLILGLIWSLIVRYQIGRSKFPPKKLMLAWLKAVLPECRVANFTSDWNSGVCLSALLDYCRPGLYPHWRNIDSRDSVNNCRRAMELAKREFQIPMILEPEYLASPFLDELSGMTYLSYFMKEDSPGYHATLGWVKKQLQEKKVNNFTTDWNDGTTLCSLVRSLGGPVPGYKQMDNDPLNWEENLNMGIRGGERLGVEPILKAKDMADKNVEHLGTMAYAAHFQWVRPRERPGERVQVSCDTDHIRINKPVNFHVDFLMPDVDPRDVTWEVIGPSGPGRIDCRLSLTSNGGKGSFTPTEVGMHRLMVYNEGEPVRGCPAIVRAMPELARVSGSGGLDPCAIGSIVEVLINSNGAAGGDVDVTAYSPTERPLLCPVHEDNGAFTATFQPDEAGLWSIAVTHGGHHIQGSPFSCFVFDPNGVKLRGLEGALPGHPFSFTCDATRTGGIGEVVLDIVKSGKSVYHTAEETSPGVYKVNFTPHEGGRYRVYTYFNGTEVKGSPFKIQVGSHTSSSSRRRETSSRHHNEYETRSSLQRRRAYQQASEVTSSGFRPIGSHIQQQQHNQRLSPSPPPLTPSYRHRLRQRKPDELTSRDKGVSVYVSSAAGEGRSSPSHKSSLPRNDKFTSLHVDKETDTLSRLSPRPKSPIKFGSSSAEKFSSNSNHESNSSFSQQERRNFRSTLLEERKTLVSPVLVSTNRDRLSPHVTSFDRGSSPARFHSPSPSPRPGEGSSSHLVNGTSSSNYLSESREQRFHSSSRETQNFSSLDRSSPYRLQNRRGSVEADTTTPNAVDSSSNLRVSTLLSGLGNRRDSWDAIAKTRNVLSYGSLESLANLAGGTNEEEKRESKYTSESTQRNFDSSDAVHTRFTSVPNLGLSEGSTTATVTGEALRVIAVHRPATITINAPGVRQSDVDVQITAPSKRHVPSRIIRSGESLSASFTAQEVGDHTIDIRVSGQRVHGAPFRSSAYNAKAIRVGRIPNGTVGRAVEFEIDGSSAGSGNLEILVNGGHVTSSVRSLGGQRFLASFVPHEAGVHTVEMTFNAEPVPGSPWQVDVMTAGSARASLLGDAVRHVGAGQNAVFEVSAPGFSKDDIHVKILSPSKRSINYRLEEASGGVFRVEFTPNEVGSHVVDVNVAGQNLPGGPLVAKAYNSSLIRVTDVASGIVGQPCQFRVDASQAGEGQLEISINDGEVPNHVQVLGGGRCLVSFTPEQARPHLIDIRFNGETVPGCPFVCKVADSSRVSLTLRNLELIPVNQKAKFHINVDGSSSAELAVSVRGPSSELDVKVSGNIHSGFTAEFMPREVGAHSIMVEYNGHPVTGTPFVAKAYDPKKVFVSTVPKGAVGKTLQFTVDASQAGEGNLEITISARGHNIPTQVHPQGNARFAVSFVPLEAVDHVISISFNKEPVPGSPFMARVHTDPHHIVVSGQSLASTAVGKTSYFTLNNVSGSVEDIEVNVEGPNGHSVPAQLKDNGDHTFQVEFTPRVAGEHKIFISYSGGPVAGSPFACKVYDVSAIRVREVAQGVVGKPVTFLVETSQAGPGNLEVTVNNGRVPTSAQAQGTHTYAISFTPREAVSHIVELRFNGENVPGSPFTCQVADATRVTVSGAGLDKVPVQRLANFTVEGDPTLGEPQVQVLSPTRRMVPVKVKSLGSGQFHMEYTPAEVGDHSVEVKFSDLHVEGSPFLVKAYDATKVKVTDVNSGVVGKPVYFSIDASQAGAGNLEIIVSVNGRNVPNYVQSEGNAKFRVNFKPQEAANHSLSVRFNGEAVPGSPFSCKILDSSQIIVSGSALKMSPLSRPAVLTIDPQGADVSECVVTVLSPSGQNVPVRVTKASVGSNKFAAEFVPFEVGRHTVSVVIDNEPVKGSPFSCNIYDVSKVNVTGLGSAKVSLKVGKPVTFTVDASEAGEGTLELVVSTAKATVKAEVVARSRGLYDVTFVPHEAIPHFVNITFNEEDVPGTPFKADIIDLDARELRSQQRREAKAVTVRGEGVREAVLGSVAVFDIDPKGLDGGVDVEISAPDGSNVPCHLTTLRSGIYRAEYTPHMVGPHYINVYHQSQTITRQPLAVDVSDPAAVRVIDIGEAIANRAASFKVDASGAGRGALSVSVRSAGQDVKHSIRELDAALYEVIYHPKLATPHRIDVKYQGFHITGCPFEVQVKNPAVGKDVVATGIGLHQSRTGKVTSFVIETLGHPAKDFDVIITGPGESAVPVRCYQQKDGNLLAEFTAQAAGTYKIDVYHGSKPVRGSPYMCQVYDASKVQIEEVKTTSVAVNEKIAFKLNRAEAGFAELDVTVTSPLGQSLPIEVKGGGDQCSDLIEFLPTVPGKYRFSITYGGEGVPGSPITFLVEEEGMAKAYGDGLNSAQVDVPAIIKLDKNGLLGEPTVQVDGPDSVAKCQIELEDEGTYTVTYTPKEVGVFDVRVMWNGKEIQGSPFHPRVVDSKKVRVIGGWESFMDDQGRLELVVNQTKKISFDVSEAGPGKLEAECHGPSGSTSPVAVEMTDRGRVKLLLTPREPGEHVVYLTWAGFALPRSPLLAVAEGGASAAGAVRVVLAGRGLTAARCSEEADFTVDGSQAGPGQPEVTLTGMKSDIKVLLQPLGGSVYRATYTPNVPGAYLLNVMWSDRQVKGCPLKVNVAAVSDSSRVICSGDGLRVGTVGKEIKSFIDTRRAGPGELTAHCVGPHKVAYCELYDHGDGTFTLNVKPQEAGRHALTIKYGGDHVPGSPFCLRVTGAPDASKVRVYGPGIEHGVLASFQSRFICDTRGAGAGQLTVRIRGPKGAFRVEMQRESQKDRTILCKFDPTEPGDYRIEVKWANENVPGSPFAVMIFDTQEELHRFLQGNHSPQSGGNSELYGSVGYSTGFAHMNFGAASWRGSQAQL